MPRISFPLLFTALILSASGCAKQQDNPRTANRSQSSSPRYSSGDRSHASRYDDAGAVEDLFEQNSRDAKRRLSNVADEADDTLRSMHRDLQDRASDIFDRSNYDLRSRLEDAADRIEEAAADMAEEAKDRAVDMPEQIERLFEPHDPPRERVRDWNSDGDGNWFSDR